MPDGPIFPDAPTGDAVQPCRQVGPKKGKGWDVPCVLKLLCKKDKHVVNDLNKLNVSKFQSITFLDQHFDGKKWHTDPFDAGGTALGTDVTLLSGDSCERAATVLFHERWHTTQPAGMDHCDKEREAYTKTEEWTIQRGLPGQGGLRTTDAKGNVIPDPVEIEKVVKTYPGCGVPPKTPRPIGHDPKNNKTKVFDPVTGKEFWRASKFCDKVDGKEVTVPKTPIKIKKSAWKCP